jgi:hypothetical protein
MGVRSHAFFLKESVSEATHCSRPRCTRHAAVLPRLSRQRQRIPNAVRHGAPRGTTIALQCDRTERMMARHSPPFSRSLALPLLSPRLDQRASQLLPPLAHPPATEPLVALARALRAHAPPGQAR